MSGLHRYLVLFVVIVKDGYNYRVSLHFSIDIHVERRTLRRNKMAEGLLNSGLVL